jgi:hypothetical protein
MYARMYARMYDRRGKGSFPVGKVFAQNRGGFETSPAHFRLH